MLRAIKKVVHRTTSFKHKLAQLVQLDGHAALLVSGIVLVQQTLSSGLIHCLDSHLVSNIGLAAVALRHGGVKLLDLSLQRRLSSLVLCSFGLGYQHALLGRLDIRQTKHLLRYTSLILRMVVPRRYVFYHPENKKSTLFLKKFENVESYGRSGSK